MSIKVSLLMKMSFDSSITTKKPVYIGFFFTGIFESAAIYIVYMDAFRTDIGLGRVYCDPKPDPIEIGFGCLKLDLT